MLPHSEASRLLVRFQKEWGAMSEKLGGERRLHDRAWEQARYAGDYLLGAAQLLGSPDAPLPLEAAVKPRSPEQPQQVQVRILLAEEDIGGFWVLPDHFWCRYYVVGRARHTFPRALQLLGNYLARKAAYYQLLKRRAQPFLELLQADAGQLQRHGPLHFEPGFAGHKNWDVRPDYHYLRLVGDSQAHTLRIFGDRYTWGLSYQAPQVTLVRFEEMLHYIRQEMGA